MGWAPGDEERVLAARVALVKVKNGNYILGSGMIPLKQAVQMISHSEKGPMLRNLILNIERFNKHIEEHLSELESQLTR